MAQTFQRRKSSSNSRTVAPVFIHMISNKAYVLAGRHG